MPFPSDRIATLSLLNEGFGRFLLVSIICITKAFVRPPIWGLLGSENRGRRACSHAPHIIQPRAVEANTVEKEERKSNSTEERRCLEEPWLEPEFFVCVNSPKNRIGITGRNGTASAFQEIKSGNNFSH